MNDALARRIEESGLNNMHTSRQLLYDGWLLFLRAGLAKRARSVNPHFCSTLRLAQKIEHCEQLYARHGLPALFRMTPFAHPGDLERALAQRGYVEFDPTLVQTATLERPPAHAGSPRVEVVTPLIDAFVEAAGAMRGSSEAERAIHLERLAQSPLDLRPVVAKVDGVPVGAGLLSIDAGIAGVFDVVTAEGVHGQGIGTAVVGALLSRAWERGIRHAFVQVTRDNSPALALYRKFGFATAYSYRYLARPGECR